MVEGPELLLSLRRPVPLQWPIAERTRGDGEGEGPRVSCPGFARERQVTAGAGPCLEPNLSSHRQLGVACSRRLRIALCWPKGYPAAASRPAPPRPRAGIACFYPPRSSPPGARVRELPYASVL